MDDFRSRTPRVVIVGGGISGLAAAHRMLEIAPQADIVLLEASDRLGGVLQTVRQDGFLVERSADNFITNMPWALDLCRRLGLEDTLSETDAAFRRAFVVCRGRLEPIPPGFVVMAPARMGPILRSRILSWPGKLRLAAERWIRPGPTDEESLATFATRRFGRETYERLVQPLVGGIYTADPEKLSVRAALPRFFEMQQKYGNITRGLRRDAASKESDSGARYSLFVAPHEGMSQLVKAVAERLPQDVARYGATVRRIVRAANGRWQTTLADTSQPPIESDAVIVATPAHAAAAMLSDADQALADELAGIEYAPCVIVSLGYRLDQIRHPLDGFGFVVPRIERRQILSASFASRKFADRAPEGCVLIRAFIGGACQAELTEREDAELIRIATSELTDLLGITGRPLLEMVSRWPRSMPQYHLGHLDRMERIAGCITQHPGLALAGNAFHGVGLPQCIESGQRAATEVLEQLKTKA